MILFFSNLRNMFVVLNILFLGKKYIIMKAILSYLFFEMNWSTPYWFWIITYPEYIANANTSKNIMFFFQSLIIILKRKRENTHEDIFDFKHFCYKKETANN